MFVKSNNNKKGENIHMMEILSNFLLPVVVALLASSGFWALLERKTQRSSRETQLLIGLAHDRIVYLGLSYINRGWVFHDELENLIVYLYTPYEKLGGNGSVLRVMEEVNKLPIKTESMFNSDKKGEIIK